MDLDFEDLITQSIITNNDQSMVSVETTQSKAYDLVYNDKDSSFLIKVKNDGFVCDECGEVYEVEPELTQHKSLQKCRKKYKTKAELKQVPLEYETNQFLQIDLSTYNEITDEQSTDERAATSEDNQENQEDEEDDNHVDQEKSAAFRCDECGRVCASKVGLIMHAKVHKPRRGRKKRVD